MRNFLLFGTLVYSSLGFCETSFDFSKNSYMSKKDYYYFYGDNKKLDFTSNDKTLEQKFSVKLSKGLVSYLNSDGSIDKSNLKKGSVSFLVAGLGRTGMDYFYGDESYSLLKNSIDDLRTFKVGDCSDLKFYGDKLKLSVCSYEFNGNYEFELKKTSDGFFLNFELNF